MKGLTFGPSNKRTAEILINDDLRQLQGVEITLKGIIMEETNNVQNPELLHEAIKTLCKFMDYNRLEKQMSFVLPKKSRKIFLKAISERETYFPPANREDEKSPVLKNVDSLRIYGKTFHFIEQEELADNLVKQKAW